MVERAKAEGFTEDNVKSQWQGSEIFCGIGTSADGGKKVVLVAQMTPYDPANPDEYHKGITVAGDYEFGYLQTVIQQLMGLMLGRTDQDDNIRIKLFVHPRSIPHTKWELYLLCGTEMCHVDFSPLSVNADSPSPPYKLNFGGTRGEDDQEAVVTFVRGGKK